MDKVFSTEEIDMIKKQFRNLDLEDISNEKILPWDSNNINDIKAIDENTLIKEYSAYVNKINEEINLIDDNQIYSFETIETNHKI